MKKLTFYLLLGVAMALPTFSAAQETARYSAILDQINLPPGFNIEVFAEIPNPRSIEVHKDSGVVFVGSRQSHIYSIIDTDGDGTAENVLEFASRLNGPNGIAIQGSFMYIALRNKVVRWQIPIGFDGTQTIGPLTDIYEGFSNASLHSWHFADFGPDGKLYVSLGVPCNLCETTANTGKIVRMNADGSSFETVAEGVRNSIGHDWHPLTNQMWFNDTGAYGMGDDLPADELNRVTEIGKHFGFPYYGGQSTRLNGPQIQDAKVSFIGAEIEYAAHAATLGLDFYAGDLFPADYKNDAFAAQYGSWNTSSPVGYRIIRVKFDDQGNPTGTEVFADGWINIQGSSSGRLTDLEELPDGSLLVSDEGAGLIYRIRYER